MNKKPRYINFREFNVGMHEALSAAVPITFTRYQAADIFSRVMYATRAVIIATTLDESIKDQLVQETGIFELVHEQIRHECKLSVDNWIEYDEVGPKTREAFIWRVHDRVNATMNHYLVYMELPVEDEPVEEPPS